MHSLQMTQSRTLKLIEDNLDIFDNGTNYDVINHGLSF